MKGGGDPAAALEGERAARRELGACHTRALAEQAVVFDLDGTLVDLRAVYVLAHQLAAREVLAIELEEARSIGVATSKLRDDARSELAGTGLDTQVDALVAFEDTQEHKPSPAPLLEALRRLRAQGGVAVGDLPTDVASARAAGLRPLAVGWGYGSDEALQAAGAEKVCQSVAELAKAIESRLR